VVGLEMPLQSLSISLGPLGFEARLHMLTWETSILRFFFFFAPYIQLIGSRDGLFALHVIALTTVKRA